MKLTTSATITSAFVLIAAPAPAAAERLYITPSGMAETVFVNTSHEEAANKIANTCASAGWAVTREMMAVKCEPKMNLFAQALTGERGRLFRDRSPQRFRGRIARQSYYRAEPVPWSLDR